MDSPRRIIGAKDQNLIDSLVGKPSLLIPENVMPERRAFFTQVVLLNKDNGVSMKSIPRIAAKPIDLHRLYLAVMRSGGFKKVHTKFSWSKLCAEAHPELKSSPAAARSVRQNYQMYLLALECLETGQDYEQLKQFADNLDKPTKKSKKVSGVKQEFDGYVYPKFEHLQPIAFNGPQFIQPPPAYLRMEPGQEALFDSLLQPPQDDTLADPFASTEDYSKLFEQEEFDFASASFAQPYAQESEFDYTSSFFDPSMNFIDPNSVPRFEDDFALEPAYQDQVYFQEAPSRKRVRVSTLKRSVDEDDDLDEEKELRDLAKYFKTRRDELEYSQRDVAESIVGCMNADMSQTTVSRFETYKLSTRNMKSVRVLFEDWLEKVDEAISNGQTASEFLSESKNAAES